MSKSYLQHETLNINVKGKGDTQHQAVEATFKELRKTLGVEFQWPIVSMRTVDYIVNNIQKTEKNEAYLYVFMKRTRISYEIDVTIKVEVDYVNIEGGIKDD